MDQAPSQPTAVPLHGPGVPADHGLSTLGLIMQLAGMLFAAFMSLSIFTAIVQMDGRLGGELGWMMLVLGSCTVRSLFHRAAGTELLYGNRNSIGEAAGSPLAGLYRYITIGLVHSALMALILILRFKLSFKFGVTVGVAFALWPAILLVIFSTGRFKHLKDSIPIAEDKGFEGASILMAIMGVIGSLFSGFMVFMLLKSGDKLISSGYGALLFAAVCMMFGRSLLHAHAGLSGLRETSLERSVDRANRYANFGVIASFSAAGALLLVFMQGAVHMLMFVVVGLICWMLLVWPLIVRRFFSDRQFADLLAGDGANLHRRAPDAGLTGLGWFLLGYAVMGLSMILPQVILGTETSGRSMQGFDTLATMFGGQVGGRSVWFSVGLIALQAWAGYELIRMTSVHKIVATVFGVVATVMTIYQWYPMLKGLKHLGKMRGGMEDVAMMYLPLAIALVIPVTTIILVSRKIVPMATARIRERETPSARTS